MITIDDIAGAVVHSMPNPKEENRHRSIYNKHCKKTQPEDSFKEKMRKAMWNWNIALFSEETYGDGHSLEELTTEIEAFMSMFTSKLPPNGSFLDEKEIYKKLHGMTANPKLQAHSNEKQVMCFQLTYIPPETKNLLK